MLEVYFDYFSQNHPEETLDVNENGVDDRCESMQDLMHGLYKPDMPMPVAGTSTSETMNKEGLAVYFEKREAQERAALDPDAAAAKLKGRPYYRIWVQDDGYLTDHPFGDAYRL